MRNFVFLLIFVGAFTLVGCAKKKRTGSGYGEYTHYALISGPEDLHVKGHCLSWSYGASRRTDVDQKGPGRVALGKGKIESCEMEVKPWPNKVRFQLIGPEKRQIDFRTKQMR